MNTYGGMDVQIHAFLTSALVGSEWPASRPGRFVFGERATGTHCTGGWVGLRAGLDDVERRKLLPLKGLELLPLGRQIRSQSLQRLHYPASQRVHKRLIRGSITRIVLPDMNSETS
jgi:hypothetical protein